MKFVSARFVFIGLLFFYPIKIADFPLTSSRLVLYVLAFAYLASICQRANISISHRVIGLYILSGVAVMTALLPQVFTLYLDLTIALNLFEIFFLYPAAAKTLVQIYADSARMKSFDGLLINLFCVLLVQGGVMLLMLFMPAAKAYYLELINSGMPSNFYPMRQIGLTGFSAYNMGLFLNLSLFLATYLASRSLSPSISFYSKLLLGVLIVLAPSLLTSRSGIIMLVLFAPFVFLALQSKQEARKQILKFIYLLLIASAALIVAILEVAERSSTFHNFVEWSFDIFLSTLNGQVPAGLTVLFDQYWLPGPRTLLFGDGYYTGSDGSYYLHTDGGYMRLILYFGLMGTVMLFAALFCIFGRFFFYFYKRDRAMAILVLIIAVSMIVVQYKGNIIIDGNELIRFLFVAFYGHRLLCLVPRFSPSRNRVCGSSRLPGNVTYSKLASD